jgi:6,7-dimethyl-8-ribityllumazine synthase
MTTMQEGHLSLPAHISSSWRIGIIHSTFHADVVSGLVRGAEECLLQAGISRSNIRLWEAAGSFEIPLVGATLLKSREVDALIGLGVIVQGETHHAELIAKAAAHGIMDLQLQYQVPFAFEILYVDTIAQARARAGGEGNRGGEAARTVLHSLAQLMALRS